MKIIIFVLSFYSLHWFLVYKTDLAKKLKWLSKSSFRYFWNVVLFLSFMPTATTGILLYLGYTNRFLIYWHNQFGIVMVTVGFLHLLGRIGYFWKTP